MKELELFTRLPVRSRLYTPAICGLGTGMVESLASYLSRIADVHAVSAADLLYYLASTSTEDRPALKNHRIYNLMRLRSRELNGTQQIARRWSTLVAASTLRQEVNQLTLLPWRNILTPRALIHSSQWWCPQCLDGWADAGQPPYWPLLWSLHAVIVCPIHRLPLEWKCQHCHTAVPSLSARGRIGFCPKCSNWLGWRERPGLNGCAASPLSVLPNDVIDLAQGACRLLAASSCIQARGECNSTIAQLLHYCLDVSHCRSVTLAQRLTLSPTGLSRLVRGQDLVSIPTLLRLGERLGLTVNDFAEQDVAAIVSSGRLNAFLQTLPNKYAHPGPSRLRPGRRATPELCTEVQLALETALAKEDPPGLPTLARQVGLTTVKILWHYYPHLCRAIIAKRKARFNPEQARQTLAEIATAPTMPPSLVTIARQLKTSPVSLKRYFPALVAVIKARHVIVGNVEKLRDRVAAFTVIEPPLSFSEVTKRVGIKAHHIRHHCPDLHHVLVQRYAEYRHTCATERKQASIEAVRTAVQMLHKNGQYPTKHKVALLLGKPSRLILSTVESEAFHKMMQELALWQR